MGILSFLHMEIDPNDHTRLGEMENHLANYAAYCFAKEDETV